MKFLTRGCVLSGFFILVLCSQSFGQAVECENAGTSCMTQCDQLRVQGDDGTHYGKYETDFKKKCEESCSNGIHNCQLQDSENGCDTFYYHCVEACPWKVVKTYSDLSVGDTNSFSQCVTACTEGQKSCQAAGQTSPRKRTGPFDECVEAQEACYADCGVTVPMDTDYMSVTHSDYASKCAKACFTGVAPCQKTGTSEKCQKYFEQCDMACPESITDEDGNEVSSDDIDMLCHDSCEKGKDNCDKINPGHE
jgi:hypothetical protein